MISWLRIDDTNIHRPVMQGRDNRWYKYHDWQEQPYEHGELFLDADNETKFGDDVSVIYGSELHLEDFAKFADRQYFKEHQEGVLFVPSGEYKLHALAFFECNNYSSILDVIANKNNKQFVISDILDKAIHTSSSEDVLPRISKDKLLVVAQYSDKSPLIRGMAYLMEKVK